MTWRLGMGGALETDRKQAAALVLTGAIGSANGPELTYIQ
jgi:hypothetical protein